MSVVMRTLLLMVCAATAWSADNYQADPAKFSAMQAERCANSQKEIQLIQKRMSMGRLRPEVKARMEEKLKALNADAARNCPNTTANPPAPN